MSELSSPPLEDRDSKWVLHIPENEAEESPNFPKMKNNSKPTSLNFFALVCTCPTMAGFHAMFNSNLYIEYCLNKRKKSEVLECS